MQTLTHTITAHPDISNVRFGKLEIAPGGSQNLCLFFLRNVRVVEVEAFHLALT
jgi:hypothetical protein